LNIEKRNKEKKQDTISLKNLKGGDVFHFANISFESALKEDAIYSVVSGGKESRVQISCVADGLLLMRDDCHKVCQLNTTMVLDV